MTFLTLNGSAVRCRRDAVQQKFNEHRLDRERMFDGTMRMTRAGVFRQWDITTKFLEESDANSLLALVNAGVILTANGDLVGGVDVPVMPVPGTASPTLVGGGGFRRQVTFTLHETGGPLPPDTTAVPWAFYQRDQGYWQDGDGSKTTPALHGDYVYTWEDQSGHSRDGVADASSFTGDARPTRDGNELHFGVGVGDPGAGSGRSFIKFPTLAALGAVDVMMRLRGALDPPATSNRTHAFAFDATGQGAAVSEYPSTTGHLKISFGSPVHDVGVIAGIDYTEPHVLNLTGSLSTLELNVYLDNILVFNYALTGAETFSWNVSLPNIGIGAIGSGDDLGWEGWARDLLIVDSVMTPTQRRSWFDYMRGAFDDPPVPV